MARSAEAYSQNGRSRWEQYRSSTGDHYLLPAEELRSLITPRIAPRSARWGLSTVLAASVAGLSLLGAVAAGGVALERTKEVPTLRASIAETRDTARAAQATAAQLSAVNSAEHSALREGQEAQLKLLERLERRLARRSE